MNGFNIMDHSVINAAGNMYLVSQGISSLSGSVIAIYGAERNDGKFTVEDFCMADLPLQTPRPALSSDR